MYIFRLFSCADTADTCDSRTYDNGRCTDAEERNPDGKRKGKNEQDEDADEQNSRESTAEKSVFLVCARGDISTQKRRYEKGNKGENGRESFGVLRGKSRKAGYDEEQDADDERNERSEKDGNEKAFFFPRLRAVFDG